MNDTNKDISKREESALALEKENATFTSQKERLELPNTKESFVEGSQAEIKSNSTKESDNQTSKVESNVAYDEMRDGYNTIPCSATSNNTNEPSSLASQAAGAASTNPERVEGDKPSSKELSDNASPSERKVELVENEHVPVASSSMEQLEPNQTGNGNTEGT